MTNIINGPGGKEEAKKLLQNNKLYKKKEFIKEQTN